MKIKNIPPVYFFSGLFVIALLYFLWPGLNVIPFPWNLPGIFFIGLGMWFNASAHKLFKFHQTSHQFKASTYLINEGIFKCTRNPMYLGMCMILSGAAICFGNIAGFVVPLIFLIIIQLVFIPYEEEKMQQSFGMDYEQYKSQVRRWI